MKKENENGKRIRRKSKRLFKKEYKKEYKELKGLTKEELVDKAIEHAWDDAVIYEKRYKNNIDIIKNKDEICDILKDEINNKNFASQEEFDKWHTEICQNELHGMIYSLWQKLINMTFKYLYCCNLTGLNNFDFNFEYCHCPIDTHIAKTVFRKIKDDTSKDLNLAWNIATSQKDYSWNYITKENYLKIQEAIKDICNDDNNTPLQFDIFYWQ